MGKPITKKRALSLALLFLISMMKVFLPEPTGYLWSQWEAFRCQTKPHHFRDPLILHSPSSTPLPDSWMFQTYHPKELEDICGTCGLPLCACRTVSWLLFEFQLSQLPLLLQHLLTSGRNYFCFHFYSIGTSSLKSVQMCLRTSSISSIPISCPSCSQREGAHNPELS